MRGERGGAPTLAVLPFLNRYGLVEDDDFADSLVEDVIDALSRGANVRVCATSVTARLKTADSAGIDRIAAQAAISYSPRDRTRAANDGGVDRLAGRATGAELVEGY